MSSPVWKMRNFNKRQKFRHKRIAREFGITWPPIVGQVVCDCRYRHGIVIRVEDDDVLLDDGYCCSINHCIWPVPHDGMTHDKD